MVNAWIVGTIVAVVAGAVGFFVVTARVVVRRARAAQRLVRGGGGRGADRDRHADRARRWAACWARSGSALLGRRGRHDVATALVLVLMLALGSLFLSLSSQYAPAVYSLLFGEILGIGSNELVPTAALAAASVLGACRPVPAADAVLGPVRGRAGAWRP